MAGCVMLGCPYQLIGEAKASQNKGQLKSGK
jgi:hypothetical protein